MSSSDSRAISALSQRRRSRCRRSRRGPAAIATPPAPRPAPAGGRASGRLHRTGLAGSSRSRARGPEASPMVRDLAAVLAPMDLEPAQRLVEITPAGQHLADARRAMDLAQPRLGGEDQAEA